MFNDVIEKYPNLISVKRISKLIATTLEIAGEKENAKKTKKVGKELDKFIKKTYKTILSWKINYEKVYKQMFNNHWINYCNYSNNICKMAFNRIAYY